jgi:hypothetical protein
MKVRYVLLLALAVILTQGIASASVSGFLGAGSSGFVEATLVSLCWTADSAAMPVPGSGLCPGQPGSTIASTVSNANEDVNSGTTLSFAGGPLNLQEGILVNNGMTFCAAPNGTTCAAPTTLPVNTFLQFESHPNLVFSLTAVNFPSPVDPPCTLSTTSGSCEIYINGVPSPVTITALGGGSSSVGISLGGRASDAGVAGLSAFGASSWLGGFSATIPPGAVPGHATSNPGDILGYFCPSGTCTSADVAAGTILAVRSVSGSFSAQIIPEPSTATLFLIGAALMTVGLKKFKKDHKG